MAALGKIRSKGAILLFIIGLALFAFIAEELFRSFESTRNDQRQQVAEVLGEKVNVQDFQKLVDEYSEVVKMQQGAENLNEEQLNQVKDMVWQTFIQTKLIEHEASALGLTVTDDELQDVLNQGTNQMLMQTPFINQQTGRFDSNALKRFLAEYKTQKQTNPQLVQQYETIYRYWTFVEKALRQQVLMQKYQTLFAHCLLSNSVEAKMAFNEENEESKAQLAIFPYATIDDAKVQLSDDEMQAKYNELKPRFKQLFEGRDVKYVDVVVEASEADRAAIQKDFEAYKQSLVEGADPAEVVRKSLSSINYLGIPVTWEAYPKDIAARIDSMSVGQFLGPFESKYDNTLNLIKLISKQELPDSIQYRQIQVVAETKEKASKTADSIYTALQGGADFAELAKKYNQTGDSAWIISSQYQNAPSLDNDMKNLYISLNNMSVNELKNFNIGQSFVIIQVLDKRRIVSKYVAAVIKRDIEFSKNTYSAAYNKFASFVSANQTAEGIKKNAIKNGYKVEQLDNITTAQHGVGDIRGTREVLKWIFSAKEGEVSPMYECGDNNHLLVVVLDKIHKKGYRDLEDPQVKEMVRAEALRDKKAEMLINKSKGVRNIAAAKLKGASVEDVDQVTFAAPVFVQSIGASEPALSGAIYGTKKGAFSKLPVKGNGAVYYFLVTNKTKRPVEFDVHAMKQRLSQRAIQSAGGFMNDLFEKAKVVDNRYLFF